MIAIATMKSVNPLVILGAMLLNAAYGLACMLFGFATTTTTMLLNAAKSGWKPVGLFLGLVAGVALAMAFWVVVAQLVGGMAITTLVGLALKALWKI